MTRYTPARLTLLALASTATALSGAGALAYAAPPDKVTLCHATGDGTFRVITVSTAAVLNGGHSGHSGDAIPAFEGFGGLNTDLLASCLSGGGPFDPEPEPTEEPDPEPTDEPDPEPTEEPEPTLEPEPEPTEAPPTTAPPAEPPPVVVPEQPIEEPELPAEPVVPTPSTPDVEPTTPAPVATDEPISGTGGDDVGVQAPPADDTMSPGRAVVVRRQAAAAQTPIATELPYTGPLDTAAVALLGIGLLGMGTTAQLAGRRRA